MPNTEQHNATEPAPVYATQAEIEMADRLRRQLRERYFWSHAHLASADERSPAAG